jgi:hypothetical protein
MVVIDSVAIDHRARSTAHHPDHSLPAHPGKALTVVDHEVIDGDFGVSSACRAANFMINKIERGRTAVRFRNRRGAA